MDPPTETGASTGAASTVGDRCPSCLAPVTGSWLACAQCGARLAVAADLPPGTLLMGARFSVGRVLGRGGFGITYDTHDTRLQRQVALKELYPDSAVRHGLTVLTPPEGREAFEQARDRFLREARVLAQFNHPGIVRVYEVFEEHGTAYLVLELLEGRTLAEVLRERGRPFTEESALDVAQRVGSALGAIHEAGLLHRDVSPSNLVVTGSGRIVLIDFGLARAFDADKTAAMTRIVTPGYAPPEQYLGSARFGPPTDVYGLAASLYRLLTAATLPSAIDRQHGTDLLPPHKVNPDVSKAIGDAVLDGLELNPDHRPQSVEAFLARLGIDVSRRGAAPPLGADHTLDPPLRSATVLVERPEAGPRLGGPVAVPGDSGGSAAGLSSDAGAADGGTPATVAHGVVPAPAGTTAPREALGPVDPLAAPRPTDTSTRYVVPAPAPVEPARPHPAPLAVDPAAYLPGPVVGPPRKGRWVVSAPVAIAAVGLVSAAPVLLTVVLVLLVLPLLATFGDLALHRHRQAWGGAGTWFQRRSPTAAAAPRFARNVVVSTIRSLPAVALLAVLVACWYPIHDAARLAVAAEWFLRLSGVAVGLLLVVPALRGSPRFATGFALDDLHLRVQPPGHRFTQAGWILWAVAVGLAAAGLLFSPDVWPLQA